MTSNPFCWHNYKTPSADCTRCNIPPPMRGGITVPSGYDTMRDYTAIKVPCVSTMPVASTQNMCEQFKVRSMDWHMNHTYGNRIMCPAANSPPAFSGFSQCTSTNCCPRCAQTHSSVQPCACAPMTAPARRPMPYTTCDRIDGNYPCCGME